VDFACTKVRLVVSYVESLACTPFAMRASCKWNAERRISGF
jgi:hypothetical protein